LLDFVDGLSFGTNIFMRLGGVYDYWNLWFLRLSFKT